MPFPKLTLTYFDIPGLAESIRLTFIVRHLRCIIHHLIIFLSPQVGGIPFNDERLTDEQFQKDKGMSRDNCSFTFLHESC